jgi:hydrogenase maturation protein HypF
MQIRGFVSNTSDGVIIKAEGDNLTLFIDSIRQWAPPLSKIEKIETAPAVPCNFADFSIRQSDASKGFTLVSPDISICSACRNEMFDPGDLRYLYPFINCTNCGPRYSITKSVPYDRINTTMQVFSMCRQCSSEYNDPCDRRFHAQPNACAECGPQVSLISSHGDVSPSRPIEGAISLLRQGKIVAVKGLGGFHIACDAGNAEAVKMLRNRKRKSNKPFAVMFPDCSMVREYCEVSHAEEELLLSPQSPIVLLRKKHIKSLPEAVAPKAGYLGVMLPYTPLHYLLFYYPLAGHALPVPGPLFSALVMTSGNISEEPIIISDEEAIEKLSGIVDAFLVHNRGIFMRVDDTVALVRSRESEAGSQDHQPGTRIFGFSHLTPDPSVILFRRSRGYVPAPIQLMEEGPDVLGCGADMKNTFTLARGRYAILSQHIGDMENYETIRFFEEALDNLRQVYKAEPQAIAYDLHPGYFSSGWAREYGSRKGLRMFGIQHHYAHIGSVMAEHGLTEKVIGVAFDGTGYGEDGTLWGGEFLIADAVGFTRAGHFRQIPLPGGEMAVREPWRTALSYLADAYGDEVMRYLAPTEFARRYGEEKIAAILGISGNRAFSPLSSGAGRLFDAVSALLGICDLNTYEGEASVALEAVAAEGINDEYMPDICFGSAVDVDFSHVIRGIVDDIRKKVDRSIIAARFHNTVAAATIRVVIKLSIMNNITKVALSGGVFQNQYLFRKVCEGLCASGLTVFFNESVPCNDAGISLGQAYLAREIMKAGRHI